MKNNIDFTLCSEDMFYDAVDAESFKDEDADTIYDQLKNKIQLIPFGDYLRRYIYLKTGFNVNCDEIDIKEYQHIIIDSFAENLTPKSFTDTSAKMSALTKNWLTRQSVSRKTVFLLGFGLAMMLLKTINILDV